MSSYSLDDTHTFIAEIDEKNGEYVFVSENVLHTEMSKSLC